MSFAGSKKNRSDAHEPIRNVEGDSSKGKEIIIHLGLPKTGTTTLQKRIFPYHSEYLYLGKETPETSYSDYNEVNSWTLNLRKSLICKDLPYFSDFDFEQLFRNRYGDEYKKYDKLFFSEENILSRCITPTVYGKFKRVGSAYSIFSKLKILLENSSYTSYKVILILRKQDDLIESIFAEEYYNFKSQMRMESPEEFVHYLLNDGNMEEIDSLFRYNSLVNFLDSQFGRENVLVLPYEKMKFQPEQFLSDLSSFMQIKPWDNANVLYDYKDNNRNVKKEKGKIANVQPITTVIAKLKHRLIGNVSTNLGQFLSILNTFQRSKIIKLDKPFKLDVLSHYQEENFKLQQRVPNIADYGYLI